MSSSDGLYIAGAFAPATSGGVIDVISPHTEEVIATVAAAGPADIDWAVESARQAFDKGPWPRLPVQERIEVLQRLAALYAEHLEEMAQVITTEMGSPISFSRMVQAPMPLGMLSYYLETGATFPFQETRPGMLSDVIVRRQPVGVVAAITPWNVPQAVTMPKLAPALVAGCTVVHKPAPESPLDALLLARLAHEAGLPPGVLNVVPAGREVGEHLVKHSGVDKVSFTGSTMAGRRIAALCGDRLARCSLELGGKSAAIILDDADLASTIEGLRFASLLNSGQACVAQTRILAPRERHDEFVDALVELVGSLRVGDPDDPATEVGPLVAERQRHRVEDYVRLGEEEGAKIAVGGGRPAGLDRGWYVEPTVFVGVDNAMRISREEIFGPVLTVTPYDDEAEAIAIANDSEYGLAGSVWTADVDHGVEVATKVDTGTFGVNRYTMEFGAPFGGFKASGLGREMGPEGLGTYLETKSIAIPKPAA